MDSQMTLLRQDENPKHLSRLLMMDDSEDCALTVSRP